MLAEEVMRTVARNPRALLEVGESKALVYKVARRELLGNIDNWSKLAAIPGLDLQNEVLHLLEEGVLQHMNLQVPLTYLNNIVKNPGRRCASI